MPQQPVENSEGRKADVPQEATTTVKKHRKELLYVLIIMAVSAVLIVLETHLPFFTKFMPISDNKLLIAILNVNLLLILLLIFLVARILLKTNIEKRRGIWGSGLKTKLTLTVFSISTISSLALFILTTWFFYISMDKWFSSKVEDAIDNAQELSQFYYEDLFGRYERMGDLLAKSVEETGILEKNEELAAFVRKQGKTNLLGYLSVLDSSGEQMTTYSSLNQQANRAIAEQSKALAQAKQPRQILPLKDGEIFVSLAPIRDAGGAPKGVLLVAKKINVKGTESMKQITATYQEFKEARPLKKILKYSIFAPLSLITLLSVFFSIWIGVKMATEITVPLERVKEGAAIIARGRFDINLEDRGKDEIGTLVSAFNSMARELKIAKDEIEERKRYMEVILDNVATGIITTDVKGNILLLNAAARDILGVNVQECLGTPLRNLVGEDFRKIIRSFIKEIRQNPAESVIKEIRLSLNNQPLYLRASLTVLRDEAGKIEGYIATFDDITHIVRSEKLATWREIAKKLTHEIKNPLTPIKLSAERLRRRVLPKAEGKEREVLDETTSVILSASEDITTMVNELTRLTHTSAARTMEDLNGIIEETIGMYRNLYPNISFQFDGAKIPKFRMDRDKVKRTIINLITNSVKAIDSQPGAITVSTRYDKNKGFARIEVADTGPGIKDEDKNRVFDPYFTKNADGTGLGLAIVHSIVLEHSGKIYVEDNVPRGAKMVIEMPVFETEI